MDKLNSNIASVSGRSAIKKLFLVLTIVCMLVSLAACGGVRAREDSLDGHIIFETKRNEWISPDGVHYWVYASQMVPRYDHNGNLVID